MITVEVFDKDKLGKDKSLGLLTFDIAQETTYATILYLACENRTQFLIEILKNRWKKEEENIFLQIQRI